MTSKLDMLLSEIVGSGEGIRFLGALYEAQSVEVPEINDFLTTCGVQSGSELVRKFKKAGVLFESGEKLYLGTKGKQCWWLLRAINGGSVTETVKALDRLSPNLMPYQLMTEGMTTSFIEDLSLDYRFRRLFICSPWIHLTPDVLKKLAHAVYRAQENDPKLEFLVITRPLNKQDPSFEKYLYTLRAFSEFGAEVVFKKKLHSKLYIKERSVSGRISQAVFGSENLTGSRNIELGIKINNDTSLIRRLSRYFFDLYLDSQVWDLEDFNESIS